MLESVFTYTICIKVILVIITMGNNGSKSNNEGLSSRHFESSVDPCKTEQRVSTQISSPPASQVQNEDCSAHSQTDQSKSSTPTKAQEEVLVRESSSSSPPQKEDNSTPSQISHSENTTKTQEEAIAQESSSSNPTQTEDNSTPSQADHSENATNKEKGSVQESLPAIQAQEESASMATYSHSESARNKERVSTQAASTAQKEVGSTNCQPDHSESTVNKERVSTRESPLASRPQKESGSTHSQLDNSNIPQVNSVSKESELMKAKQGDESIKAECQSIINKAGESTDSNAAHVSKELESTKAEQDEPIKAKPLSLSRLGKPRATDITSEGIEIEWTKPEQDTQNITSYTILYHSASDPDDQWKKKTVNGTEERATVSGLTEYDIYDFKVQSVCNGLKFEESETLKQVTMEFPTQKNILPKAWRARAKWHHIGIQLGREGDLEAIRISNHHVVDDCFTEMIKKWLDDEGGSWRKLIDALSNITVGYYRLAKSVAASLGLSATFHDHTSLDGKHS